jgi:hypothetical protein
MHRTTLILLDHIRSPLKLLREGFDYERRGLERSRQADPQDPMAQKRHQMSMMRTTAKPDDDHHWRWNGKGWYTRPDWNNGRCPPNSEPTDHNSCLPMKGHRDYNPLDHAQYDKSISVVQRNPSDSPSYFDHVVDKFPHNQGSTYATQSDHGRPHFHHRTNSIRWNHKDGPQLGYWMGNKNPLVDARPLPSDPSHLPHKGHMRDPTTNLNDPKLPEYYVKQGFSPDYIAQSLGERPSKPPPE